jgi:hypothetical protein
MCATRMTKAQLIERLNGGRKFESLRYKAFVLQTPTRYVYNEIYSSVENQFHSIVYVPELAGTYSNGTTYITHIIRTHKPISISSLKTFFIGHLQNDLLLSAPPFLVVKKYNTQPTSRLMSPLKLVYSDNEGDDDDDCGNNETSNYLKNGMPTFEDLTQELFGSLDGTLTTTTSGEAEMEKEEGEEEARKSKHGLSTM